MVFADDEAAMDWMDANQLTRRNLKPDQLSYLRGRRYSRTKKATHGNSGGANQYSELGCQFGNQAKTAEEN
jgi:hypothetical protein